MVFIYSCGRKRNIKQRLSFDCFDEAVQQFKRDHNIPLDLQNRALRQYLLGDSNGKESVTWNSYKTTSDGVDYDSSKTIEYDHETTFYMDDNSLYYEIDIMPMCNITDWWTIKRQESQ